MTVTPSAQAPTWPPALITDYASAVQYLTPPTRQRPRPFSTAASAAASLELGVHPAELGFPAVTVVGSMGKGTAAIAASASLAAAGLRVGTVTSPSFISQTERIRVDGRCITENEYAAAAVAVRAAVEQPRVTALGLHPHLGGMHFLAAISHFRDQGLDAAVFEASMGGMSDEVSLLDPVVVVLTEVLEEHLGKLGDNVYEIAMDKLGAVGPGTRVVVTVEQSAEVRRAIRDSGIADRCRIRVVPNHRYGHHTNTILDRNIELGRAAAEELLDACPGQVVVPDTLRLDGRCSTVGQYGMVDGARTANSVTQALRAYRARYGAGPEVILAALYAAPTLPAALEVLHTTGAQVQGVYMPSWTLKRCDAAFAPSPVVSVDDVVWPEGRWLGLGSVFFRAAAMRAAGEQPRPLW